MKSEPISLGTIVKDRYEIIQVLGQGGFGRTYLAKELDRFKELCVLKEFCPSGSGEYVINKSRELFTREAEVLYKLKHPQIPQFRAWFEETDRLFLVQDYIQGKTYGDLLNLRRIEGRTFSEAEVIQWLRDLLPVLDYIHSQNIIHRDISPDNIMLPDGGTKPILIDFGVVKQAMTEISGARGGSGNASMLGKWGYSPHEQLRMGQCYPNSDLYSLAVTAIVLLTGKNPDELFDGHALEWRWQNFTSVSDEFALVLNTMLSDKPRDRYQSVAAVFAVLPRVNSSTIPAQSIVHSPDNTLVQAETVLKEIEPKILSEMVTHTPTTKPAVNSTNFPIPPTLPPHSDSPEPTSRAVSLENRSIEPVQPLPASEPSVETSSLESKSFLSSFKKPQLILLSIAVISALIIGGIVIDAVATTRRATQQKYQTLYDTANQRLTAVKILSDNPQTPEDIDDLRNRLNKAIEELTSIPDSAPIYTQAQQALSDSRNQLQTLDSQRKDVETQQKSKEDAQQKLAAAEKFASDAQTQQKSAQTVAALTASRDLWRKALDQLKLIKAEGAIATTVKERSQAYEKQIKEIDAELSQLQTPQPQDSPLGTAPLPELTPAPEPTSEPNPVPEPAPEPAPTSELDPEPAPEPAPEPEPAPAPYYDQAPTPEPYYEPEPAPSYAPAPAPEPYYEPEPAPSYAPAPSKPNDGETTPLW